MSGNFTPENNYLGLLLGLAAGDALGAQFEGGVAERAAWWLLGRTRDGARRWTDDGQRIMENGQ